jgi:hypothetical protein
MGISYVMLENEYIVAESFSHTMLNGGILLAILVMAVIGVAARLS